MLFRKKKKPLFGATVEPSCSYCRHSSAGSDGETLCTLRLQPKGGTCKKYEYDPLLREPRTAPALKTDRYSEDDFKL